MEHVGGDMFDSVPKGDAIFLKVKSLLSSFFVLWLKLEVVMKILNLYIMFREEENGIIFRFLSFSCTSQT